MSETQFYCLRDSNYDVDSRQYHIYTNNHESNEVYQNTIFIKITSNNLQTIRVQTEQLN